MWDKLRPISIQNGTQHVTAKYGTILYFNLRAPPVGNLLPLLLLMCYPDTLESPLPPSEVCTKQSSTESGVLRCVVSVVYSCRHKALSSKPRQSCYRCCILVCSADVWCLSAGASRRRAGSRFAAVQPAVQPL